MITLVFDYKFHSPMSIAHCTEHVEQNKKGSLSLPPSLFPLVIKCSHCGLLSKWTKIYVNEKQNRIYLFQGREIWWMMNYTWFWKNLREESVIFLDNNVNLRRRKSVFRLHKSRFKLRELPRKTRFKWGRVACQYTKNKNRNSSD